MIKNDQKVGITQGKLQFNHQKKSSQQMWTAALHRPKRNMGPETECLQNVLISEYGPAVQLSNLLVFISNCGGASITTFQLHAYTPKLYLPFYSMTSIYYSYL